VLYLAVWGTAGVLLALVARGAGAERLTAGFVFGPCVGAWLYVANGVSILAVRQIPAHQAFQVAASEQAIAIPAILAGVAGALLGRSQRPARPRAPTGWRNTTSCCASRKNWAKAQSTRAGRS